MVRLGISAPSLQGRRCSRTGTPESTWEIDGIHNEHNFQRDRAYDPYGRTDDPKKIPSYASVSLSCHNVEDNTPALARVYVQIPDLNTEHESPGDRARQAREYTPTEVRAFKAFNRKGLTCTPRLLGHKQIKQNNRGPVPDGFLTYLVWEIVPGERLGTGTGKARNFWTFDRSERDLIREAFKESLV